MSEVETEKLLDQLSDHELMAIMLLNSEAQRAHPGTDQQLDLTSAELLKLAAGDVDKQQRQRMLAAIAEDDSLYLNWLLLLEGAEQLQADKAREPASSQRPGWWRRTADWWQARQPSWFIGPVLAACLVVLVLPTADKPGESSRQLYDVWGSGLNPNTPPDDAGFRGGSEVDRFPTIQQQWFEWGLLQGIQRLGDGFEFTGLPRYKLQATQPDSSPANAGALMAMGELVTLTYFYCQQRETQLAPEFFKQLFDVLNDLQQDIEHWGAQSPNLIVTGASDNKATNNVCRQSKEIIKKVILSK